MPAERLADHQQRGGDEGHGTLVVACPTCALMLDDGVHSIGREP